MRVALLALIGLSLIIAAASAQEILNSEYPMTIVDSANRTVTINEPVETIVPIIYWSYEPILILGLKDNVVGVTTDTIDDYGDISKAIKNQSVGDYHEPDYEKIIELDPDLVIVGRNAGTDAEEKLASSGIPVVWLNFNNLETFYKEFKILASLTGTDETADSFLSWKQEKLDAITSRTSEIENKVRVYPNWCDYPLLSASNGSGIQEEIKMAGGINIASGLSTTYPEVDPEWIVTENPEIIIIGASGCKSDTTGYSVDEPDVAKTLIETTSEMAGLSQTDAVKNSRIFVIDGSCEEAVRGIIGAYYLAKWFYPEEFEDLDPEEIHREYFEEWLGVPYQGIWAYPQ